MANKGSFQKGHAGLKPKGAVSALTKTVKEVLYDAFNHLQTQPKVNLREWGKKNPTEFYKICAKLIPAAVDIKVESEADTQVFVLGGVTITL